ncbi:MAG TPA: Fe-S-containing hydro-lyase [bacterium]|nr:Fe-S-containing hydro-lyase [bacterium]
MAQIKNLKTPLTNDDLKNLRVGDKITLTGAIYSARDAAHKRIVELIDKHEKLPFDLQGAAVYYVGPSPAKPGYAIGSAGPTTSGRMDAYTPLLISKGLKGMIGKGPRSAEVKQAMKQHGAVYFAAVGGAGALISKSITKSEVVAYPELGAEAIRRMEVKELPLIVAIDMFGNDLYETGKEAYKQSA